MKRPTRTSGIDELTQCARAAGYATVAEWVTVMHETLEDVYERTYSGGAARTHLSETAYRERLIRVVRGR